jgi:LSD1 subclass zinc finger protein
MLTHCGTCNKSLKIPDDAKGKKVRCPICQAVFVADEFVEDAPEMEVEEVSDDVAEPENFAFGTPASGYATPQPTDAKTQRKEVASAMRSAAHFLRGRRNQAPLLGRLPYAHRYGCRDELHSHR